MRRQRPLRLSRGLHPGVRKVPPHRLRLGFPTDLRRKRRMGERHLQVQLGPKSVWVKPYQYYGKTYLRVWVHTDFTPADGRQDYTTDVWMLK